jgi:single-stranded DNA-binding protein
MKQRIEAIGTVALDPDVQTMSCSRVLTRITLIAEERARGGHPLDTREHRWHTVLCWGEWPQVRITSRVRVQGEHVTSSYVDVKGRRRKASEIRDATVELVDDALRAVDVSNR